MPRAKYDMEISLTDVAGKRHRKSRQYTASYDSDTGTPDSYCWTGLKAALNAALQYGGYRRVIIDVYGGDGTCLGDITYAEGNVEIRIGTRISS